MLISTAKPDGPTRVYSGPFPQNDVVPHELERWLDENMNE